MEVQEKPRSRTLPLLVLPLREEASWWRRLKNENDPNFRNLIFERYQEYAKRISHREYFRRPPYGFEKGDFEQNAYFGLLQAIDRYDPLSGCSFKTFARYRIIGAIADAILKSSEQASLYKASEQLKHDKLKSLLAETVNDLEKNAVECLTEIVSQLAIGVLIETITPEMTDSLADKSSPNGFESLKFNQLRRQLLDEVGALPAKQKQVVEKHYIKDMTFTVIAKLMELSKGRVSQLHKSALERLRQRLKQN